MQRRSVGPFAWLLDDVDDPAAWASTLRSFDIEGITEIVPAERTVLVVCDRDRSASIGARLDEVRPEHRDRSTLPSVTIDVVYDGPDLPAIAEATGLDVGRVIDLHVSGAYTVAFCGFSPGFAYLRGLALSLQIPRRDVPRTRVPAGSVAIAAGYTSVYPSASPGGWHLLGSTKAVLWDATAAEPALLSPGMVVHFRQVDP
jgi:KipI family sensor histidine kinase inhibitor